MFTQCRYDTLVLTRVPPKDVFDDNDGFRDNIRNFGIDKAEESLDTVVGSWLDFDG